jgi:hypothetical protein
MRTLSSACRKPWSPCGGMKRVYHFGTRFQYGHAMGGQRHVARHRPMPAPNQPHIRDSLMRARDGRVVANVVRAPVRPATRWTLVVSMVSATLISGKVVVRRRASLDVLAPGLQRRRGPRSEYGCAPRAPRPLQGATRAGGADGARSRRWAFVSCPPVVRGSRSPCSGTPCNLGSGHRPLWPP